MTEQEREFQWWQTDLYCERNTEDGGKKVFAVIDRAMISIHENDGRREAFNKALFEVYVSFGDNNSAMRALAELIESGLAVAFSERP